MHKIKVMFFIAIICSNTAYTMDGETTPHSQQITSFNKLLSRDMEETSLTIEKLTTGWKDSKRCLATALAGVGLCAAACATKQDTGLKMFGMGATLFAGSGFLAMVAMDKERRERDIYITDQVRLDRSIKELTQIISQITHTSNTQSQQTAAITTSTSKQTSDAHLELIKTCNQNYPRILENIQKLTAEYSPAKICFYIALSGIFLGSLAWLNRNNNSLQMAGIGSILFFGAGSLGTLSGINELQSLKDCIDKKATTRESIMQINRS